jgi:hypothetical protein
MVLTHSYLRTDARFFRSHGAYIHTTLEKGSKTSSLLAGTSMFLTPARSGSHRGRAPAHDLHFHHPPTSSYLKGEESHCHGTQSPNLGGQNSANVRVIDTAQSVRKDTRAATRGAENSPGALRPSPEVATLPLLGTQGVASHVPYFSVCEGCTC